MDKTGNIMAKKGACDMHLDQLKERQRMTWETGDYSQIGTTLQIVSEVLCEQADLRAGSSVLDVCTGSGNTAIAAARRWCRVTGVDFSPQLLYQACARAQAEHLTIDFQTADVEALPCEDGAFDVVMSTFGVMFAPNQEQAASELLRVCRSGGKIALANWGPGDFVADLFNVSATYAPPPEGLPSPLRWDDLDTLIALLGDEVESVSSAVQIVHYRYQSARYFVDHLRQFYGPTSKAFEAAGAHQAASFQQELADVCGRFNVSGDSTMVVPANYLSVVFQKR
jgi:ubiquinone/menaquinone biosynthesis C-methylase UbiE